MTTLSEFGGGVAESECEQKISDRTTPGSRCEAVVGDGKRVRRCQNTASSRRSLCHLHQDASNVVTVAAPVEKLIDRAGRRAGQCRAVQGDGDRCSNSTTATELRCGLHENAFDEELVDPATSELDQSRIKQAVAAVKDELEAA